MSASSPKLISFFCVHGFVKRYGMLVVLLPNFNVKRENLCL